jgi:hypothetical protein
MSHSKLNVVGSTTLIFACDILKPTHAPRRLLRQSPPQFRAHRRARNADGVLDTAEDGRCEKGGMEGQRGKPPRGELQIRDDVRRRTPDSSPTSEDRCGNSWFKTVAQRNMDMMMYVHKITFCAHCLICEPLLSSRFVTISDAWGPIFDQFWPQCLLPPSTRPRSRPHPDAPKTWPAGSGGVRKCLRLS